jgi:hypothetical protein
MKTWILPSAVVLAALGAVAWERQERDEASARLQQELKVLEQRLESQSRQSASELDATRRLAQRALEAPVPSALAVAAAPVAVVPQGSPERDTRKPVPASPSTEVFDAQAMADHLEAAFFHESVDREWADSSRRSLQEKALSLLPEGSSIRSLECQATLCRMELVHENNESYRQFQRRHFQEGPLWKGASVTRMEKGSREGEVLTVAYFAREGHALPLPDVASP